MANGNLAEIIRDHKDSRNIDAIDEFQVASLFEDALKDPRNPDSPQHTCRTIDCYSDLQALDSQTLAVGIEALYAGTPEQRTMNRHFWEELISPYGVIREDFDQSIFQLFWGRGGHNEKDMLIRAIPGHAHNGHCAFNGDSSGRLFPNTTTEDVVAALAEEASKYRIKSHKEFAERTQEQIDEIVTFYETFFKFYNSKKSAFPTNPAKRSLCNLKFIGKYPFSMIEGARAFFYGGMWDNYSEVRKSVKEKYSHQMGGGEVYTLDFNRLKEFNIGLAELAKSEYSIGILNGMNPEKRIEVFRQLGIVIDSKVDLECIPKSEISWSSIKECMLKRGEHSGKDVRPAYIRDEKGKGFSDDIGIVLAAFLPQTFTNAPHHMGKYDAHTRQLSAFFADRIDTNEKDASYVIEGGQDQLAAEYINLLFGRACESGIFRREFNIKDDKSYDLISEPVLTDFTAAGAITSHNIHSSQRYFLMRKEIGQGQRTATCALKEYIRAVYTNAHSLGMPVEPLIKRLDYADPHIKIGFDQISLKDVLYSVNERIKLIESPHKRQQRITDFFRANGNGKYE